MILDESQIERQYRYLIQHGVSEATARAWSKVELLNGPCGRWTASEYKQDGETVSDTGSTSAQSLYSRLKTFLRRF